MKLKKISDFINLKEENLTSVAALFLMLAIGIFIGFSFKDSVGNKVLVKDEISEKVVSFVNSNFFSNQGQTASVVS